MTLIEGVDLSYDRLTPAALTAMRGADVQVVFQCLWTGSEQPRYRVTNLRVALSYGFTVGGYISVTGEASGDWHVEKGRAGVPRDIWDALVLVPVDVELYGISNSIVRGAVNALKNLGKRPAIYTNYNCWVNRQGNPTNFTDCLLWNAYWDANRDINFASLPYGGWGISQVVGEQYRGGGTSPFGVNVDRNVFVKEVLMPYSVPENPCVLHELVLAWQEDMQKLALGGINAMALRWILLKWEKILKKA